MSDCRCGSVWCPECSGSTPKTSKPEKMVWVIFDKEKVHGVFTDPETAQKECDKARNIKIKNGCQDTTVWCVPKSLDRPVV